MPDRDQRRTVPIAPMYPDTDGRMHDHPPFRVCLVDQRPAARMAMEQMLVVASTAEGQVAFVVWSHQELERLEREHVVTLIIGEGSLLPMHHPHPTLQLGGELFTGLWAFAEAHPELPSEWDLPPCVHLFLWPTVPGENWGLCGGRNPDLSYELWLFHDRAKGREVYARFGQKEEPAMQRHYQEVLAGLEVSLLPEASDQPVIALGDRTAQWVVYGTACVSTGKGKSSSVLRSRVTPGACLVYFRELTYRRWW